MIAYVFSLIAWVAWMIVFVALFLSIFQVATPVWCTVENMVALGVAGLVAAYLSSVFTE